MTAGASARSITVIGSVNMDLVVEVDRLPREGETVLGGSFRAVPGGKGANQAAAAARLGARTAFVGCVGDDGYGRLARENLARLGVDVTRLETAAGAHTGVALIMVDASGRNKIAVAPGANARVEARGRYDIALTQLETPYKRPDAAFLILNPAPAPPPGRGISLEGVDVVIPNEIEAEQITGEADPARAAAALRDRGARRAIVTLGEKGVYDGGYHPAFPVRARDTVGAGDTFVGAFAAALARGDPDPVRFAQAAAALKCTRPGAQNIPTRKEVLAFLAEN